MKYFLKHITEINWLAGILLSVAALAMWIPDFISPDSVWKTIVCLLLTVGNGVLLMYILYQSGVTRTRISLPVFCYVLAISSLTLLHTQWESQLSILALQTVLLLLLKSYRSANAVHESFIGTIVICSAAILQPDILVLLIVLWAGLGIQRAFNLRVILASLSVVLMFMLYKWLSAIFWPEVFGTLQTTEILARSFTGMSMLAEVCYTAIAAVLFTVLSLTGFARENSRAQSLVLILIITMFLSGVLMLFPPKYFASLLAIAVYTMSALASYCFASGQSVAKGVIFLLFVSSSVTIYFLNLYNII